MGIMDSKAYIDENGNILVMETIFVSNVSKTGIANGILQINDIIRSIRIGNNEKEITRQHQVIDFMLNARIGDTVYMTVLREVNGVEQEVTVEFEITKDCISSY